MAKGWLRTCLAAGLAFYEVASGLAIAIPPPDPTLVRRQTAASTTANACALAASASSSVLAARPTRTQHLL